MSLPPYIPVDCIFHDRLLHWATRKEMVEALVAENGVEHAVSGIIEDVWTESGAEFLRFAGGPTFRLDLILSVNGHPSRGGAAHCAV